MADRTAAAVTSTSLVVLRYGLALADGTVLVSTFGGTPATFQLGSGQLAEPLERCLEGMQEGDRRVFELAPDGAFGPHVEDLVQRVGRTALPPEIQIARGEVLELQTPEGHPFTARVIAFDADSATLDFNHPLAGRVIRFEVEIVGVL